MPQPRSCPRSRAGYTLPELVTVIALMSLLMAMVYGLVDHTVRYHRRLAEDVARLQRTSFALDEIRAAVRQAHTVDSSAQDGSGTYRLVLIDDGGRRTAFFVADGSLYRRMGSGAGAQETLLLDAPVRLTLGYEDTPWAPSGLVEVTLVAERGTRRAVRLNTAVTVRPRR